MEHLSLHQLALLCRDAISREPAASRCPACAGERQLGWEFDLVCPACGASADIEVLHVRPNGTRWQAVDPRNDRAVAAVGDTIEAAFNRARSALNSTPAVIVVSAPQGTSALAYPSRSARTSSTGS